MPSSATISVCVLQNDRRVVFDASNQIARHAVGETTGSDEHVHAPGGLRQKHGGLAGGVSAAHHNHLFTAAQLGLDERRPVVHTRAFEL